MSEGNEIRIGDADRQVVIESIQRAMVDGYVHFDELETRFEAVYAAETRGQLDAVTTDLPGGRRSEQSVVPVPTSGSGSAPVVRHQAASSQFSLLGDSRIGGWITVGNELSMTTVIGDSTIDLSTAEIGSDGVSVTARNVIGDVRVIVPDGARVELSITTLIGSRKEALSAPRPGAPTIKLDLTSVVGDVQVYSLSLVPEGKLRKLWNSLRKRE